MLSGTSGQFEWTARPHELSLRSRVRHTRTSEEPGTIAGHCRCAIRHVEIRPGVQARTIRKGLWMTTHGK